MGTPTDDVIAKLAAFGSQVREFRQGRRLDGSGLTPGQVDDGFCRGVCIDWMRRILQSGNPAFSDDARKVTVQTLRQATIQLTIDRWDARRTEVIAIANQLGVLYNAQALLYNRDNQQDEVAIPNVLVSQVSTYLDITPSTSGKYKVTRVGQWINVLTEVVESSNHRTEVGWAAFAKMMDTYHLEKRKEQLRNAPSKRPFSHIRILASSDREAHGKGSIFAALAALFSMEQFVRKNVLIINFELIDQGRLSGHAVALYKRNDGGFYFFDPNYGVFNYTGNRGVLNALLYLFGAKEYGGPIYAESGDQITGRVSYLLFGLARS